MKCSVAALASLVAISSSSAFVGNRAAFASKHYSSLNGHVNMNVNMNGDMNAIQTAFNQNVRPKYSIMALSMSTAETDTDTDTNTNTDADSTTEEASTSNASYDVVKVDLSNNRDYPIYIGDGFNDEEAGELLRSHITGNRALLVTNDLLEPLYLDKYQKLLQKGGDIQIGACCCKY
eukprot:scaffold10176_cov264-Chaetoceros_neogracile.AAC.1